MQFLQRLLITVVLLPIGLWALFSGETPFAILIMLFFGIAAWEYANLFKNGGHRPAIFIIVAGTVLIILLRAFTSEALAIFALTAGVLVSLTYYLWRFERGDDQAVTDLTITVYGLVYVGFIGSYFVALRGLPGGAWWTITVFAAVWWADTAAYFIGSAFGKHRLSPRLSPKKSWEGYLGGIVVTLIGSPLLLRLYHALDLPVDAGITVPRVLWIALVMGVLPTLGDLGISLLKRHFSVKDTGHILLAHGGMLDRVDAWIWAMAIGYYMVTLFFLN